MFCTCLSGLVIVCGEPASGELQYSNLDRMHELTSVLAASSVRYWQTELMCLISMYAALHVLMICCFTERLLSKMKPRLRTIPENSISVLLRVIVCGSCTVVLTEEEAETGEMYLYITA